MNPNAHALEHRPFIVPPGQLKPASGHDCQSVPEPSAALFLSLTALLLFRRSRRIVRRPLA